jgi:hypothetical protein
MKFSFALKTQAKTTEEKNQKIQSEKINRQVCVHIKH